MGMSIFFLKVVLGHCDFESARYSIHLKKSITCILSLICVYEHTPFISCMSMSRPVTTLVTVHSDILKFHGSVFVLYSILAKECIDIMLIVTSGVDHNV